MGIELASKPNWDLLYEIAGAQEGYFTTRQAAEAGYSTQLLLKHIRRGRVARTRRGVYRLVHFPAGEHEELAVTWLWSDRAGVFSHQTALALHGLSDALPAQIHLTLPVEWRHRRLRVPNGVVIRHGDVPKEDRVWFGPVPVTSPRRTLADCARESLSPELLGQASRQALTRGLVAKSEIAEVEKALSPFGGLAP
jgi:predicted transcriptional regulator of viral defense system